MGEKPVAATLEQRKAAVEALMGGNTKEKAAELAGVSRQTLYRWMREDKVFLDLYDRAKGKFTERIITGAAKLTTHSIEVLDDAVQGVLDDKIRIDTAKFAVEKILPHIRLDQVKETTDPDWDEYDEGEVLELEEEYE